MDGDPLTAASATTADHKMADWIQRLADIALNIATTAWTFTLGIIFTLRATFNDGAIANAPATANRPGFESTGNGTGAAFKGTASATSGSSAFEGVGAGSNPAARLTGAAGVAGALVGNGTAATGATRQDALKLTNGDLDLSAVTAPTNTTSIANRLTTMNLLKAWCLIQINGTATFTVTYVDGFNVASVARNAAGSFIVTFGSGFATGNYGFHSTCIAHNLGSGADVTIDPSNTNRGTGGTLVAGLSVNGTSVTLDNWGGGTNIATMLLSFYGAQ